MENKDKNIRAGGPETKILRPWSRSSSCLRKVYCRYSKCRHTWDQSERAAACFPYFGQSLLYCWKQYLLV